MSWRVSFRLDLGRVAALLTWVIAIASFVPLYTAPQNTLLNNFRWFNMKAKADPTLNGVGAYLTQTQALAGNRLHLDAWHGYHEVLAREKVQLARMDFQFHLGPEAYLVCIFDRSFEHFKGFRLSTHPGFPNAALEGNGDGAFTKRNILASESVSPDHWHQAALVCRDGEAILHVDGHEIGRQPYTADTPRWVGFRGGAHSAQVDNVRIADLHRGVVLEENFAPYAKMGGAVLRIALAGALISGGVLLVLSWTIHQSRERTGYLISFHLCAITCGAILSFYAVYLRASYYPEEKNDPVALTKANEEAIYASEQFSVSRTAKKSDTLRVLFIGTSQTFGCGADSVEARFFERIAAALGVNSIDVPPVECRNSAIPGANSTTLIPLYRTKWQSFAPDLVVVNLGINDLYEPSFPSRLENLVKRNAQSSIATVFVREAASIEFHPEPLWTHEAMKRVAEEYDIPCWDSYGHLAALSDTGFLWWDVVHPTSYGHRLIAEFLLPRIEAELSRLATARHDETLTFADAE